MFKRIVLIFGCGLVFCDGYSQVAPVIEWQKCLGGTNMDVAASIQQTMDGGYIVAGYSSSNDGDVSGNHSSVYWDYWIVKLNVTANIIWQKCFGGTSNDVASSILQTSDGGYIVAGQALSTDGDVIGNHGNSDYWILKLDSSGIIQWNKVLGGSENDWATSIEQTHDGGYIVAGSAESNNGNVSGNHGWSDFWIMKIDSSGTNQWKKCLGGSWVDNGYSALQTIDGGYIIAGITESIDGNVSGNHGGEDGWLVKVDSAGILQWQKCFGGTWKDGARPVQQTNDGGYIFTDAVSSNDGDVSGNHGDFDAWVVKTDSVADIQWQKCLGGTNLESSNSIKQTNDGGYIVAGYATSDNGDVIGIHDTIYGDMWIVKLDNAGIIQWQKCLGGSNLDEAYSIQQTMDGGYIVAGYTFSNDGDVSGNHSAYTDMWVVKLGPDTITSVPNLQSSPSSGGNNLQLFPNPSASGGSIQLTINTKHNAPLYCEIINMIGERVLISPLPDSYRGILPRREEIAVQIDVSFLAKGVYFIRVGDGEKWENRKLVIE